MKGFGALQIILLPLVLNLQARAETAIDVVSGIARDGKPTQFWIESIRSRISTDFVTLIVERRKPLTASEREWAMKIRESVPHFKRALPSLTAPFAAFGQPEKITLVLGNQGGDDAFTCSIEHICIDLSQWAQNFGQPKESDDSGRIVRILSHEYTHLLTKLQLALHPYDPSTAFEKGLLDLYVEGLGHYYSLSSKWISSEGQLSEIAKERIKKLEPELVSRLVALKSADIFRYRELTAGMNAGRFEEKWGALPIALWLSKETGRKPALLRHWVERGPNGILELIRICVGEHLRQQLDFHRDAPEKTIETSSAFVKKNEHWVFYIVGIVILAMTLVLSLWHGRLSVFWHRKHLRAPDLLSLRDKIQGLLIPSPSSLAIICAVIFLLLGAASQFLGELSAILFEYDRATFVTIQAGTMAILFPLVILILGSSDEANSLVVSKREVLLRHALAFPIGLALLILSLYFVFNGSPVLASIVTIASIILSLIALYRLLEITFSFEVAKVVEERILAARVHRIAADDLAERVSYTRTAKAIKEINGPIDFKPFAGIFLEDRADLELIKIEVKQDGVVTSISLNGVENAAISLDRLLKKSGVAADNSKMPFGISLSAYPGKVLNDQDGRELATIILPQGLGSAEFRAELQQALVKAIKVSSLRSKRSATLDLLMSKLSQSGRLAVRDDNLDLMNSIKDSFELLYISISDLLEKHSSSLEDIEDPRMSRTFGGNTSNPFESLINQLVQLQREVIRKKDLDEQIIDRAIFIPHALAHEALSRNDRKAYISLLRIADTQLAFSVYYKSESKIRISVIEWLSGILKYKLLGRMHRRLNSKLIDEQMELARLTVIRLQAAARFSLDANDTNSAAVAIKKLAELLMPTHSENFEYSIETLRWRLEHAGLLLDERKKVVEELQRQLAALSTERTLRNWYEISLVAIAGYALQCIDGANGGRNTTKEIAEEVFRHCISRLPSSFQRVFELQLYARADGDSEKWGWRTWESHPPNQIFSPHTDMYIKRVFALLFYRSSTSVSEKFTLSSYELNMHVTWPFRKDEHGLRKEALNVPASIEGRVAAVGEATQEQLDRLFSLFDEVERESKLQDDLRIVNQELMPEKIGEFRREFVDSFNSHTVFRRLFYWSKVDQKKELGLELSQLIYRDGLIAEPNVSCSGLGAQYGEELADGEDQSVFDELLKLAPRENTNKSIEAAAKEMVAKGISRESIRIIVTRKYAIASIEEDKNFVPKYRLRDREFPHFVIGIYQTDNGEIPVIQVSAQNHTQVQGQVVCNLENLSLFIYNSIDKDILPELHISLQIRDPIHDDELQKVMLERDKGKFQGIDPNLWPKLTGKMVYLKITEGLEVKAKDPALVFGVRMDGSDTRDHDDHVDDRRGQ